MLPARRIEFVNRLMSGIQLIGPATQFEPFGGIFMRHWKGVEFISTGINPKNNPITRNADLVSPDGSMAAEFSAEQGYFGGGLIKLRGDLAHSREKHPQATEVYLLSSQLASAGQRQAFPRAASLCKRKHGVLVQVLDARRIAELIVDNLLFNDLAIGELGAYLPELKRVQDEFAADDVAPPLPDNHVSRPGVQAQIAAELAAANVISIFGLAGNGKSVAAAEFAHVGKGQFDIVMWLDANNIKHVNELKSRQISRVGESRNVLTLLANQRALLVLDDLSEHLSANAISAFGGSRSKVIITRRDRPNSGSYLNLELMTADEAKALLNSGEGASCPEAILTKILDTVGGHPFTLGLMNAAVRVGGMSWVDIEEDCERGKAANFEQSQERVADRILSRTEHALGEELSIFRWVDSSRIDRRWFVALMGNNGEHKLRQHGLVSPDRSGVVRLHDIVFESVKLRTKLDADMDELFAESLNDYIESVAYSDDLAFTSLAFTLAPKLDELVGSGRPGIAYAWLRSWDAYERELDRLGDLMEHAKALAAKGAPPSKIQVAVVLEIAEIKYRHLKVRGSTTEAKDWLKSSLAAYDVLAAIPGLDPRSVADILHHRGKALNLTNQKPQAIEAFEAVLALDPRYHESRLQLARLYAKDKPERALELANDVFKAASEGSRDVTSSVLLATAEALTWVKLPGARRQYMEKYGDLIEARLIATVESGSDQAFTNFASVGRDWAWHEPERYAHIYKYIPTRALDDVKRDNDRFTYADIRREGAETALKDPAAKEAARIEALAFFKAMEKPNAFQVQKLGQLYVEWGKYKEAVDTLEGLTPSGIDSYRKLWLSKAYLGLGRKQEAFVLIDEVVKATPDEDTFASTFYAQRFETRHALGDAAAREDIERAIELSTSDAPKQRLIRRKEEVFGKA